MNDSLFSGDKLKELKQRKRETIGIIKELTDKHSLDMQLKLNSRHDILEYINTLQAIPLDQKSNDNNLLHL